MSTKDTPRKRPSGAQQRKSKREREEAAPASQDPAAQDRSAIRGEYNKIGPPPSDPLELVIWGAKMAAVALWDLAMDPTVKAGEQRRGVFEAVRTLGMVSPKAIEKKRLVDAARKAGLTGKKGRADDGTEPRRRPPPDA